MCARIEKFDGCFLLVAHMLSTLPPFLQGLEQVGRVAGIIPKRSSIDQNVMDWAKKHYDVLDLSRREIDSPGFGKEQLRSVIGGDRFVLLDIGGYFAPRLDEIYNDYSDQLIGAIEDTENGHQKYAANCGLPVPCISVARSLSKRNEDRWVGQSIVFSAETLLRDGGATLDLKRALVIGFGKIGQSIARSLKDRGLLVEVLDADPNQRVYARCEGFQVGEKRIALQGADLVFCATGNESLKGADFRLLKGGSVVFSVTSSEDEFDFRGMGDYKEEDVGGDMVRMSKDDHSFFLANWGNAVNFLHGAEVRPYVHLVQAAMLQGVDALIKGEASCGWVTEISKQREAFIAETFERRVFSGS